jgi:hypothetical protein
MGVRKEKLKQFDISNLPFYYLTSPLQKKFNTHKLLGKLMLKFPVAYIPQRNTWKMCSENYNNKPIMSYNTGKVEKCVPDN